MFETYLQCIKGRKDDDIIRELSKRNQVIEFYNQIPANCNQILANCNQITEFCNQVSANHNQITVIYYLKGIYQNKKTLQQWEELRQRNNVSLDINLYSMGLIVCRKGLKRQSYILKR
jgi:short-subunit dehydrogenase involved in D-alanine esterification of teichoic acids